MGDESELELTDEQRLRAVKFIDGSDTKIEGLAIPFGGPNGGKDLEGEDFGPDVDIAADWFPDGRPILMEHGLNGHTKATVQGRQTEHELTDEGIFARGILDKSARYHKTVAKLVREGRLFFSSGSMPHLIEYDKANPTHIKRWPWVELSLTATPANPFAAVHAVKSTDLIDYLAEAEIAVPAPLIAAALKALDGLSTEDDALPDGAKFADLVDRLSVDGPAWIKARKDWHLKSGRVLSAATRERLMAHPSVLRQLADDLDELLASADAPSDGKSVDLGAQAIQFERTLSRLLGVSFAGEPIQ